MENVSRDYAAFSICTKIGGDFGGVIYVFRNSGICKMGKKNAPDFLWGLKFVATSKPTCKFKYQLASSR